MVAIPNLPLRRKTPAHTPPADAPESIVEAVPPAVSTPNATAPRMPSQGHTQEDDDDNIPPPPLMPDGVYLSRLSRIQFWTDKDTGKTKRDKNGNPMAPTVFFVIDDPAEQRLMNAGKPHRYGVEFDGFKLEFGDDYRWRTVAHCATLGAPEMTWPKNSKTGNASKALLAAYLLEVTKGKKFLTEVRPEAGKGEHKTTMYKRMKSLKTAPAAAKAKPAPAPAAVEPDPIDTSDDNEVNTVLPGDAEDDGDGVPF